MEFRKASIADLEEVKRVYSKIVQKMLAEGYTIWDEVYPTEFFEDDIKNDALYVLYDGATPVSAFALYDSTRGDDAVTWEKDGAAAFYLDRFGINVDYQRKGCSRTAFDNACDTARTLGAEYLRLFVVDENLPAISFYEKCGMKRVDGYFNDHILGNVVLKEYGYEIKL